MVPSSKKITPRVGRRQPLNILQQINFRGYHVQKCYQASCDLCPIIASTKHFYFINGRKVYINASMNCQSNRIIYALFCKLCSCLIIQKSEKPISSSLKFPISHMNNCRGDFILYLLYKMPFFSHLISDTIVDCIKKYLPSYY